MFFVFQNVGNSLKTFAKINIYCSYVLAVICAIGGLSLDGTLDGLIVGAGVGLIWILISYYGSMLIYGFGQLINDVREIKNGVQANDTSLASISEDLPEL